MSDILHPYNHAQRNWTSRNGSGSSTYPLRDLSESELHERLKLIDPLDMSNVILRSDTALNPATSLRLLELLARDETYLVRYCVTLNPATPADLVEEIMPTLSKYFLTESFRGWRDLYRIRGSIRPERYVRLLQFPDIYPGTVVGSAWILSYVPKDYVIPRNLLMRWIVAPSKTQYRHLMNRAEWLDLHDLWFDYVQAAPDALRSVMADDLRIPSDVRAFAILMAADKVIRDEC